MLIENDRQKFEPRLPFIIKLNDKQVAGPFDTDEAFDEAWYDWYNQMALFDTLQGVDANGVVFITRVEG